MLPVWRYRHGLFRRFAYRDDVSARLVWGYYTAAVLRSWTVQKSETGDWSLRGGIDRADPFKLATGAADKKTPLLFTVPRAGGFLCFPVRAITIGREQLTARLGPPEY
jgi:hypothetical protein